MLQSELFKGDLVHLTAEEPKILSEAFAKWRRDAEYVRLLDNDPASLWSAQKTKEWLEKDYEKDPDDLKFFFWGMRTLDDERLIGFISLSGIQWNHGDAFVGIGIGERDCWGKGYGTDAMRIVLRYAFRELNLQRVSLGVFEYNPRAVSSYKKAGFSVEGIMREHLNRDGRRWDLYFMGILREEWEQRASKEAQEV
jgi:RimJ/RimL family protein N-acetyltransferase